jgi:hypothetical protein
VVALQLTGLTCLYLAMMLLVLAAGTLSALALGVRNRLILLTIGMVTIGVLGMIVFWVYLIGAGIGHITSVVLLLGCALACGLAGRRIRQAGTGHLIAPLLPVVVFFCASSLFSVALGYLRGGTVTRLGLAGQSRYLVGLPDDNELPWYLIRQLQASQRPLPHYLAKPWQTSDRPPMQSGIYLMQHSLFGDGRFLDYQLVSMIAQSLWIFGVWAFLVSARLTNRAVTLGLAVTTFSSFVMINTFFVWPKLLPAAYLMLVGAALLSNSLPELRRSRAVGLAIGAAVGCAMLGHPGSIFVVLSMAVTLLVTRALPSVRVVLSVVAGIVVMYLPWMLFQKYYAPPGDFLDKFQLANTRNYLDKRTLSQAVVDAYQKAGMSGTVSNKVQNLSRPFKGSLSYPHDLWHVITSGTWSISGNASYVNYVAAKTSFFSYVPAMGLMAIGMVLLPVRFVQLSLRRARHTSTGSELRSSQVGAASLVCLVITYLIWAAVLFGPGATITIQSSYYMELVGLSLGVIGWWLVSPRLCMAVVVAQSALTIWLTGFVSPHVGAGHVPISSHVQTPMLLLAIAALLLTVLTLRWIARSPDTGFAEQPDLQQQQGESAAALS